jgi:hypothetical protein
MLIPNDSLNGHQHQHQHQRQQQHYYQHHQYYPTNPSPPLTPLIAMALCFMSILPSGQMRFARLRFFVIYVIRVRITYKSILVTVFVAFLHLSHILFFSKPFLLFVSLPLTAPFCSCSLWSPAPTSICCPRSHHSPPPPHPRFYILTTPCADHQAFIHHQTQQLPAAGIPHPQGCDALDPRRPLPPLLNSFRGCALCPPPNRSNSSLLN